MRRCARKWAAPWLQGARPYEWAHVFEAHAPAGKDGFLATNSLLASCVLTFAPAYGAALLEAIGDNATGGVEHARGRTAAVVLHAGWSAPVATDLESKLNESAIAAAQVADYRNFGHGRHLGLARRPLETLVIALITPETADLAERTLKLFPPEIPIVQVRTEADGPAGTLDLLGKSFRLSGQLGELQDFDPGRPSVPDFGRKLYHVAAKSGSRRCATACSKRKLARTAGLGYHDRAELERALAHFTARLSEARLGAIVLDYDGTLCGRAERFGSLRGDIATECQRLLEGGLLLGIATGQGALGFGSRCKGRYRNPCGIKWWSGITMVVRSPCCRWITPPRARSDPKDPWVWRTNISRAMCCYSRARR